MRVSKYVSVYIYKVAAAFQVPEHNALLLDEYVLYYWDY